MTDTLRMTVTGVKFTHSEIIFHGVAQDGLNVGVVISDQPFNTSLLNNSQAPWLESVVIQIADGKYLGEPLVLEVTTQGLAQTGLHIGAAFKKVAPAGP